MALTTKTAAWIALGLAGLLVVGLVLVVATGTPDADQPVAEVDDEHEHAAVEPSVEDDPPGEVEEPPFVPGSYLKTERVGEVTVVNFTERVYIEQPKCDALGDQLDSLVEKEGHTRLLLNMSSVGYLSSPGLERLVKFKKKAASANATVKICCIQPDMRELFHLTRVERLFEIYPDQQAALDAFGATRTAQ